MGELERRIEQAICARGETGSQSNTPPELNSYLTRPGETGEVRPVTITYKKVDTMPNSTKKFAASITGKVVATRHAGTSGMGNPSYWVAIERNTGGSDILKTSANSGLAYEITNPNFRDQNHTFELTKAGRLSGRYTAAN